MSDLPVGEVTTLSELLCASPQRVTVAGTARLQLEAARLCDELEAMTNERDALRARVAELEAELQALREQKPAFWYLPADDEDGEDEQCAGRVGKRSAGRLLDGVQHDGYPEAR